MTEENKIMVCFNWVTVTPDRRAYKPSAPQLSPIHVTVGLEIPLTREFITNASEIVQARLSSGNGSIPELILTPIGMRYCIDELERAMSDKENKPNEKISVKDDDDWGDVEETPIAASKASNFDDAAPVNWDDEEWN